MTTTASSERASSYEMALAASLRHFIAEQLGRDVAVDGLRRLAGGTAHETWGFELRDPEHPEPHQLVLRRDVERGMLDGDLRAEYELLTTLSRLGVAVPRTWWCVVENSPLGQPFMIVDRVHGTDIRKHLAAQPDTDRHQLGVELVRVQTDLHQLDRQAVQPASTMPHPGAGEELDKWIQLIQLSGIEPHPLLSAATSWLADHIPHTARHCLVHGDFKTNNLLFGTDGHVTVLDWELAHIGDPEEDVAWTLLWTSPFDLVGGLLSAEDYQSAYEEHSGFTLDPGTLLFWRIFALVKLSAIFLTGVARGGPQGRPTLQLMGRGLYHIEAQLGDLLQDALPATAPKRTEGSDLPGAVVAAPNSQSFDGFATLATVCGFLTGDVLPAIPRELAGEVRAAVKLLETAATEFNDRPRSLAAETHDLIGLCAEIARMLDLADVTSSCTRLTRATESAHGTLTALEETWREARTLTSTLISALQQAEFGQDIPGSVRSAHHDVLARTYACLAGHARSRLTWQSVFPTTSRPPTAANPTPTH